MAGALVTLVADDVALAAAKTGAPPHEVASRAEEAWRLAQRRAAVAGANTNDGVNAADDAPPLP